MREKVKALWQQCFDDTPEFVELYFRLRYTDEVNLAVCREGEVVAAMQLLPYPMTFYGKEIPTAYLSGVCTRPDYRGQGIMAQLLARALERMYRQGVLLSTLIPAEPWLFDYYAKAGYASVFSDHTRRLSALPPGYREDTLAPDLYDYLDRRLHQRPCCIQHTEADFRMILADLRLSGGSIHTRRNSQGQITALAVLYPHPAGYILGEHLCDNPADSLPVVGPTRPLGMARLIHAEQFLSLYAAAHPAFSACYALTDAQLPANNGYYRIDKGICSRHTAPQGDTCRPVTIHELTEELLRPLRPYMSLMLNL